MSDTEKTTDPLLYKLGVSNGIYKPIMPEAGIGGRIKDRRKELGLTVDKLAELSASFDHEAKYADGSGVARATIYSYESGSSRPGAREIRILCEALNMSPSVLLLGEEWDRDLAKLARIGAAFQQVLSVAGELDLLSVSNRSRDEAHKEKLEKVLSKK